MPPPPSKKPAAHPFSPVFAHRQLFFSLGLLEEGIDWLAFPFCDVEKDDLPHELPPTVIAGERITRHYPLLREMSPPPKHVLHPTRNGRSGNIPFPERIEGWKRADVSSFLFSSTPATHRLFP